MVDDHRKRRLNITDGGMALLGPGGDGVVHGGFDQQMVLRMLAQESMDPQVAELTVAVGPCIAHG